MRDYSIVKNNERVLFVILTVALLIIVLGVTGALNIMSFQQNYTNSLISSYAVVGSETVRKIEYAVKYGKPLDSFYGVEDLLDDTLENTAEIEQVQVILNNGIVIYDQEGSVTDRAIPELAYEKVNNDIIQGDKSYTAILLEGNYHIFIPISDKEGHRIGSLGISFDENVIRSVVGTYQIELIEYLLLLVALGILGLILVTIRKSFLSTTGKINKKRYITIVLIILGMLQVAFGFLNYLTFKDAYLDVARQNTETVATILQSDINSVVAKGITYSELYNIEDYFNRLINSIHEVDNVHLVESNQIYSTMEEGITLGELNQSEYRYSFSLISDVSGRPGTLWIDISKTNINLMLRSILLDMSTIFVISFLFMVEITLFFILLMERRVEEGVSKIEHSELWNNRIIPVIRYVAFMVFAAGFMSASFIPVLMNKLYQPIFALPKSVILGLPISSEMLFGAMAALWAGYSIDKIGCKPIFVKGIVIFCIGTLLSGFAWDALSFIAARGIVGVGFGLVLMALRTMVISTPDCLQKNQGIAAMNSGALAGVNCGVMIGAMLADRIGFSQVFFAALLLLLITLLVGQRMMDNVIPISSVTQDEAEQIDTRRFLLDSKILSMFLLVLIPIAICGMFLHYFFPIFAQNMNVSSSNVGRAFLLNGLCIIYLGPILSKYSERYLGTEKSLVLATLVMGASLIIFAVWGTLAAAFTTVILLGIADSFGVAAQSNYYLNQRVVSRLGEGKAMAYFSLIGKFGQTLGPIAFGAAAVFGMVKGVGVVGSLALALLILFVVIVRWSTATSLLREKKLPSPKTGR